MRHRSLNALCWIGPPVPREPDRDRPRARADDVRRPAGAGSRAGRSGNGPPATSRRDSTRIARGTHRMARSSDRSPAEPSLQQRQDERPGLAPGLTEPVRPVCPAGSPGTTVPCALQDHGRSGGEGDGTQGQDEHGIQIEAQPAPEPQEDRGRQPPRPRLVQEQPGCRAPGDDQQWPPVIRPESHGHPSRRTSKARGWRSPRSARTPARPA